MKRKKRPQIEYRDIDLNIMPFIDVFSLLNTFLLMSAAFLTLGILEVQVPFLAPATQEEQKPERTFSVDVDLEKDKVTLITKWSAPPINEEKEEFDLTKDGLDKLHERLVAVRRQQEETDKITFFTEEEVTYRNITDVLDAVKLRREGDPVFRSPEQAPEGKVSEEDKLYLYPKVVLGSVIL